MGAERPTPERIASLDQFRGYTVAGMFLVNFVGGFLVVRQWLPTLLHWHDHVSYADTIMPQFFFAVGFAYRLTLRRRLQAGERRSAYARVVRRGLGLILLGIVLYHFDGGAQTWQELRDLGLAGFLRVGFQRNVFQTLVHIGVTSLWVLPVMAARPAVRVAWMAGSCVLFAALSHAFYYAWVMQRPGIDGGPLGFLTWTVPLLTGSLAYDAYAARGARGALRPLLGWAVGLMLLGYGLANLNLLTPPNAGAGRPLLEQLHELPVEPPFVRPTRPVNEWTMSQRAGSVSYLVFGAGFSLAVYAAFVLACDVGGARLGLFATLGGNALAAYILHELVERAIKPYTPRDAPGWYVAAAFAVFFGVCYLFLSHLEKNRLYLRL